MLRAIRECSPHAVLLIGLVAMWGAFSSAFAIVLLFVYALTRLRKITPTFLGQFITMLGGGAAAYAIARAVDGRIQVEFCALFLAAPVARLSIAKPIFGRALDVTSLMFALVALGASHDPPKWMYVASSVAFAISALAFLSDAPHLRILRARFPSAIAGAVIAAATAATLTWIMPKFTGAGANGFWRGLMAQTGFTGRVRLGAPSDIQTSDEIVMRIRGGDVDYLRGAVLDTFDNDTWYGNRVPSRVIGDERGPIVVTMVKPALKLFAPRGGVALAEGATIDTFGTSTLGVGVTEYTIDPHGGANSPPPTARDTQLPKAMRDRVATLANEIIGNEKDPEKALRLIDHYLQTNYRYTLTRHGRSRTDSQLYDFLFYSKEGHCEFFATAMAVLARSVGIPTHVIAGYRVVEKNAYGDYSIVRDMHAHAWVEAWVPSKSSYVTFDPTPNNPAMEEIDSSSLGAFVDAARVRIAAFGATLGNHPVRLLGVLTALTAFLLFRGPLSRLRRKKKEALADDPRPYFVALMARLKDKGLARESWEGLEPFAIRLENAGENDAAVLVRRYAAYRYGNSENDESMSTAFSQFSEKHRV